MKATPRPWTNDKHDSLLRGSNGEQIIFSGRGFALACGVPSDQSIIDADFALNAANEYDGLRARIAELEEALSHLLADVLDYERVNNLAPNPGRKYCWDSSERAARALKDTDT